MGILEFGIILTISSVAFCGTILPPFNYKIFENNVVPLDISSRSFIAIPNESYKPINDNFLMKEILPPRTPANEYGPPKNNDIFFKPPADLPSLPESTPEIALTTEASLNTRLDDKEMKKSSEENVPSQGDEMLFKPIETTTPKFLLPPGLPELPPSPKIPLTTTTTTESPMSRFEEEFSMEEKNKPSEEFIPPQNDAIILERIEQTTPKVFLPPGLPELPPAPVFTLTNKTTTTEDIVSRYEDDVSIEEMRKPAEEYGSPSLPEQPFINPMMMLPELPPKMIEEMVEILKPMEEISVTTSDGHNFNIKISVTANTNFVQPSLPQIPTPFFMPGIKAPKLTSFPPGIPPSVPSIFPQQSLNIETPMIEMSSALPNIPSVPIITLNETPYPSAVPMNEISSRIGRGETTAESIMESSTPASINNAPYPPALPYSKYGQL